MSHAGSRPQLHFASGAFHSPTTVLACFKPSRAKNDEINYDDDFRSGCEMVGSTCGLFKNSPFWIIGHM